MHLVIKKIELILSESLMVIGMIAYAAMFLIVIGLILIRDFFGISAIWTYEVAIFFMMVVGFVGSALAFTEREKGHIAIAYFVDKLPVRLKKYLQIGINLFVIWVSLIIFYGAYLAIPRTWNHLHGGIAWFKPAYFYILIAIAMSVSIIFILIWIYDIVRELTKST